LTQTTRHSHCTSIAFFNKIQKQFAFIKILS
jgi:hypothetical protein